jgi:hypothetical protein
MIRSLLGRRGDQTASRWPPLNGNGIYSILGFRDVETESFLLPEVRRKCSNQVAITLSVRARRVVSSQFAWWEKGSMLEPSKPFGATVRIEFGSFPSMPTGDVREEFGDTGIVSRSMGPCLTELPLRLMWTQFMVASSLPTNMGQAGISSSMTLDVQQLSVPLGRMRRAW